MLEVQSRNQPQSSRPVVRPWTRAAESGWFAPLLVGLSLVGIWYAGLSLFQIPPYLLPPPHRIVLAAAERWESLGVQVFHTFVSAIAGFGLSAVIGILVAIVITQSDTLRRGFAPYTSALQTVPIIAVAPIIVIWLGAGKPAIITVALIVSIFPVIANTSLGLTSTEKNLEDLLDLHSASRLQKLLKLKLPYALPHILGGLRISSGLAVIGAILGEFVAGVGGLQGGIGYVITVAARMMDMEYLFAAVLASVLMGLLTLWTIERAAAFLLRPWLLAE